MEQEDIFPRVEQGHRWGHRQSRRLSHPRSLNVWERLGEHAYIPATMVPLMVLTGGLWILLLQRWAKPVIWSIIGSLLVGSLVCAFLPLFLRAYECEYDGTTEMQQKKVK